MELEARSLYFAISPTLLFWEVALVKVWTHRETKIKGGHPGNTGEAWGEGFLFACLLFVVCLFVYETAWRKV